MRITCIYGNMRKQNTYNVVQIFKQHLVNQSDESIHFDEIFLPKDLPEFCLGCFNCFLNGEETCPHYNYVKRITDKMEQSDSYIISSPVYGFNVTSAMKNFIDHLCYTWLPHRPKKNMFKKNVFIISTVAGKGLNPTIKTIKTAFNYMGIKKIFTYGCIIRGYKWDRVSDKIKIKVKKDLEKKAKLFANSITKRKDSKPRIWSKIIFFTMKNMIKKVYQKNDRDKLYWKKQGWLDNKSPWK